MRGAQPFEIAVLWDFASSDARARGLAVDLDLDNVETFLGRFRPRLALDLAFCAELEVSSAAHLHPDVLCRLVHGLSALLEAREEVRDPRRAAELASEAGAALDLEAAPSAPRTNPPGSPTSDRSLLDDLLGSAPGAQTDPVRRLARSLGEAAADRSDTAAIERRRNEVDRELGARLRALLGHPELRRLEALCLGLRALAREAPDPERVRIRVVDAPAGALEVAAAGLRGASFVVAAHGFAADESGFEQLRALSRLSATGGFGALAALDARSIASADAFDSELERLRAEPAARHLGLCLPRVLARLPYGAATEAIEAFPFEELETSTDPSQFVWCDGALAAARAVARCATETLGTRELSRFLTLDDLPVYVGQTQNGPRTVGPTEAVISEREAEALAARGLDPLVAIRGSDRVQIASLRALDGGSLFER